MIITFIYPWNGDQGISFVGLLQATKKAEFLQNIHSGPFTINLWYVLLITLLYFFCALWA
jgi:hypothetical protein